MQTKRQTDIKSKRLTKWQFLPLPRLFPSDLSCFQCKDSGLDWLRRFFDFTSYCLPCHEVFQVIQVAYALALLSWYFALHNHDILPSAEAVVKLNPRHVYARTFSDFAIFRFSDFVTHNAWKGVEDFEGWLGTSAILHSFQKCFETSCSTMKLSILIK